MKSFFLLSFLFLNLNIASATEKNILDELDPRDPNIEEILQYYDEKHHEATGEEALVDEGALEKGSCYQSNCPVWARISLAEQIMYLSVDGQVKYAWLVSTGKLGYRTPRMDQNPNGRIYDRYTSITYPRWGLQWFG